MKRLDLYCCSHLFNGCTGYSSCGLVTVVNDGPEFIWPGLIVSPLFSDRCQDLDKEFIIGFIKKIDNDFLVAYNEERKLVQFFNPSPPELEILSREFEKWLRFNRL